MDTFNTIISLFNQHLIRGIFISVLLIVIVRKFYKKIDTQNSIRIVKWLLITYSTGVVLNFLLFLIFSEDSGNYLDFWDRAKGPYFVAYWAMFIASCSSLLLFSKKLSGSIYFILFLSILMNFGWLFESYVIHITSIHRDYVPINSYRAYLPFDHELLIVFKGMILGIASLAVGNLVHLTKKKKETISSRS